MVNKNDITDLIEEKYDTGDEASIYISCCIINVHVCDNLYV